MNIRDLVLILEENGLIVPDEFGRQYSKKYPHGLDEAVSWNPKKSGLQVLRDDGSSSSGIKQEILYDLEKESPIPLVIRNTLWRTLICYGKVMIDEDEYLVDIAKRTATHSRKIRHEEN